MNDLKSTVIAQKDQIYLHRGRAELMASSALCNLGQVVHQPLKYISSVQVTVIIHIDIHHTLGICEHEREHTRIHTLEIQAVENNFSL